MTKLSSQLQNSTSVSAVSINSKCCKLCPKVDFTTISTPTCRELPWLIYLVFFVLITLFMSYQQDVLLPQVPLFLVDRGWRTAKSKNRPSKSTIPLPNQDTRLESTNNVKTSGTSVDKVTGFVACTTRRKQTIEQKSYDPIDSGNALVVQQSQHPFKPGAGEDLQFINTVGTPHLKRPDLRKLVKSHVKKRSNQEKRIRRANQSSDGHIATTQAQSKLDNAQTDASGSVALLSMPGSVCTGSTTMYCGHGSISSTMTPKAHSLLDYCAFKHIPNGTV